MNKKLVVSGIKWVSIGIVATVVMSVLMIYFVQLIILQSFSGVFGGAF